MYFLLRYLEVKRSRGNPWDILGCAPASVKASSSQGFGVPAGNPDTVETEDQDVSQERDRVEMLLKEDVAASNEVSMATYR